MASSKDSERTITVPILTRVEGEGGLTVRLHNGQIRDVELRIYEPPRLFEALLRGRSLEDVPDIVARICGICPVAYQMNAVHALETALGVQVTPEIRALRRLLYCGEWIESHSLHIHLLHAPDFFGCESGMQLAQQFPEEIKRGLRLKKHGNQLLEVLGGRAIHPVNVAVGGFYRAPRREELAALIPNFEWGLQAACDAARWVASFPVPDFTRPYQFVALSHPNEYPMNEGSVACSDGTVVPIDQYERHFVEEQVPHSTALHSLRLPARSEYFVGPLARINLCGVRLAPTARKLADELGWTEICRNPFRGIVARALEVVHAYDVALSLLRAYRPPAVARVAYEYRAGEGCSVTEAPRGMMFHRYRIDSSGKIELAKIVPPTSQNQAQIETDLRDYLPRILGPDDSVTALHCERLIRSYDPCISCSTHFLKLRVESTQDAEALQ